MSSAPRKRVLIVDDEPAVRFGVRDFLETAGLEVDEAESCAAAEKAFREGPPDVAILDHMLPDGNALDLLPRLREIDPSVPVVVLTGHATDRPRGARGQGGRRPVPRQARRARAPWS